MIHILKNFWKKKIPSCNELTMLIFLYDIFIPKKKKKKKCYLLENGAVCCVAEMRQTIWQRWPMQYKTVRFACFSNQ